jgi:hypothetical protein
LVVAYKQFRFRPRRYKSGKKGGGRKVNVKDGLQEVPKGDNWLRRHFSFTGNFCLHLRDISALRRYKKGYKSPISNLTHRTTGFRVPLHAPPCSFSLLFSTNKIFPASAAGVHLCFHSQSGLKNPEIPSHVIYASNVYLKPHYLEVTKSEF